MIYLLIFAGILIFLALLRALRFSATEKFALDLRMKQMQYIANAFHLSFASKLPDGASFTKEYLGKQVELQRGIEASEVSGVLDGHRILIKETFYPQGYVASHRMGSPLVSYLEIDGKGEQYQIPGSIIQTEIPLDKLWDILRDLAGPTTDAPQEWPRSAVQYSRSQIIYRVLLPMILLIIAGIAFIMWQFIR